MSFVYTPFKAELLKGNVDMDAQDWRVMFVMSNTTSDTDQDAKFIADIGTLDEMDGANYVRKALATEAVNQDNANNRAEFDADDLTWTALGAGTRNVVAAVLYRHVTNDADSVLAAYLDSGGFPFAANGGNVSISWSVEGILQAT